MAIRRPSAFMAPIEGTVTRAREEVEEGLMGATPFAGKRRRQR